MACIIGHTLKWIKRWNSLVETVLEMLQGPAYWIKLIILPCGKIPTWGVVEVLVKLRKNLKTYWRYCFLVAVFLSQPLGPHVLVQNFCWRFSMYAKFSEKVTFFITRLRTKAYDHYRKCIEILLVIHVTKRSELVFVSDSWHTLTAIPIFLK